MAITLRKESGGKIPSAILLEWDRDEAHRYLLDGSAPRSGRIEYSVNAKADYKRLKREEQYYKNIVQGGQELCQICQVNLTVFDRAEKEKHLDTHTKIYQDNKDNQVCPLCENEDWGYMQASDRVLHIEKHVRELVGPCICPWCNKDLTALGKDEQQDHIALHVEIKCAWPTCPLRLNEQSNEFWDDHYKSHINQFLELREPNHSKFCALCELRFDQWDDSMITNHFQSHCPPRCAWPGCNHIFSNEDVSEMKEHILTHCKEPSSELLRWEELSSADQSMGSPTLESTPEKTNYTGTEVNKVHHNMLLQLDNSESKELPLELAKP